MPADHSQSHGVQGTRPTLHRRVDDIGRPHTQLRDAAQSAPEATAQGEGWFVCRSAGIDIVAEHARLRAPAGNRLQLVQHPPA